MKPWIGKSLIVIAIIHTLIGIGLGVSEGIFAEMLGEGLVNTVVQQYDRNAAFWFLYSGFGLGLLGMLLDWCERRLRETPRFLGWALLALTVPGVVIMPQSGLWLVFIPTVGLLLRRSGAPKPIGQGPPPA